MLRSIYNYIEFCGKKKKQNKTKKKKKKGKEKPHKQLLKMFLLEVVLSKNMWHTRSSTAKYCVARIPRIFFAVFYLKTCKKQLMEKLLLGPVHKEKYYVVKIIFEKLLRQINFLPQIYT